MPSRSLNGPYVGTALMAALLFQLLMVTYGVAQKSPEAAEKVSIQVDFAKERGPMKPIWAWWGYDGPNYTYMKDGTKLLSEISALSPAPVYVRAHSLLVTDEGPCAALKRGSSNVYTEDKKGNPVYNWAFEFENQSWFAGFRDMATNGVDKPVLNVFRMFGMMQGNRVEVSSGLAEGASSNLTASTDSDLACDFTEVRDASVRGEKPDINALPAIDGHTATVMGWNYHDDNILAPASPVEVKMEGIPVSQVLLHHYRIDQDFSNSYKVWKAMGSPQNPSPEQITALEKAGQLQLFTSPEWIKTQDGEAVITMELPRQGVSLLRLSW